MAEIYDWRYLIDLPEDARILELAGQDYSLDFANETFDAVILNFPALFSKSIKKRKQQQRLRKNCLKEALRILKPKGLFVILDKKPFLFFSQLKEYYCRHCPSLARNITDIYLLYPDIENAALIFPQHRSGDAGNIARFGFRHIFGNSFLNMIRVLPFFSRGVLITGSKAV